MIRDLPAASYLWRIPELNTYGMPPVSRYRPGRPRVSAKVIDITERSMYALRVWDLLDTNEAEHLGPGLSYRENEEVTMASRFWCGCTSWSLA